MKLKLKQDSFFITLPAERAGLFMTPFSLAFLKFNPGGVLVCFALPGSFFSFFQISSHKKLREAKILLLPKQVLASLHCYFVFSSIISRVIGSPSIPGYIFFNRLFNGVTGHESIKKKYKKK